MAWQAGRSCAGAWPVIDSAGKVGQAVVVTRRTVYGKPLCDHQRRGAVKVAVVGETELEIGNQHLSVRIL